MKSGKMRAAELEQLRAAVGLSKMRLAKFFGVDPRTMRRYSNGDAPIPRGIAFALRLMVEHQVEPERLDRAFRKRRRG